jgi:hypothetical protein
MKIVKIKQKDLERMINEQLVNPIQIGKYVYDTYKIDYSITEASSVIVTGENYQRVGTMFVSGRTEFNGGAGAVLLQDVASEMIDTGLSGNVTFTASLVGTNIIFNVTKSVGRELAMKYIVKRWSSL